MCFAPVARIPRKIFPGGLAFQKSGLIDHADVGSQILNELVIGLCHAEVILTRIARTCSTRLKDFSDVLSRCCDPPDLPSQRGETQRHRGHRKEQREAGSK